MIALLCLLIVLLAWNIAPLLMVLITPIPWAHKAKAIPCFIGAGAKCMLVMPVSLLAPLIVPIALIFTKREDNKLPSLFRWWDNDVSINGDQVEGADTYYALGHDRRSFYARYVWLGLRNRASKLAQDLGYEWQIGDQNDREHWGDPLTGRDHSGWTVNRCADVYQLYICQRLSSKLCLRINYGYKVWAGYDQRQRANVVNITFSVLSWKGNE